MSGLPTPDFVTFALEVHEGIARVALNRPDRANAFNHEMWRELGQVMRWIDATAEVRVAILGGRGRHFTAGIDLDMLGELRAGIGNIGPARQQEALFAIIRELQATVSAIEICRKPIIAAIHGACFGGGIDIASACDLRYASADARFSVKEIDLAVVADLGTLQRLPRIVGEGVAREWIFTAREFDAEEAAHSGFLSGVAPDLTHLQAKVSEIARSIAAKSPLAVRGLKAALNYSRDHSVTEGLAHIAAQNASLLLAPDVLEAIAAQRGKRPARFDD